MKKVGASASDDVEEYEVEDCCDRVAVCGTVSSFGILMVPDLLGDVSQVGVIGCCSVILVVKAFRKYSATTVKNSRMVL